MSEGDSIFDKPVNALPTALPRWNKGDEISAERLNAPVDALNRAMVGVPLPRQVFRPPRPAVRFWARVKSSTAVEDADNQYTYEIEKIEKTTAGYGGWTAIAGDWTGTAYNRSEDINAATGKLGNGATAENLDTDDFTFTMQPLPVGLPVIVEPVRLTTGVTEYWIVGDPNGIDGSCDE